MKLSEKQGGNFTPHDEGNFKGVCVDVTPLEKVHSEFGERDVFRLVFETDGPAREDGSRQCVWSRNFTPSLNEKANFRKFLRQWRGRDISAAEATEFDTESLIGTGCNLVIVHEDGKKEGQVFANIVACTPCKDSPLEASGKFTRKKDRDAKKSEGGEGAGYRKAAEPTGGTSKGEAVDNTQAGLDWTKVKVHVGHNMGVELRDLDEVAIGKLVKNWLPVFKKNEKPTADDKRLAAALEKAQEALAGASAGGDF